MKAFLFRASIMITAMAFGLMHSAHAQLREGQVVDEIVAVVGSRIVLHSDLKVQARELASQLRQLDPKARGCELLRNNIKNKMMLAKAAQDSLTVSEDQINGELDRRIQYFVQQFGSERRLEKFYEKSITEIRDEMRPLIEDQLLTQQVEQGIFDDLHISPSDVRAYYRSVPRDSLPLLNTQVQLRQILRYPKPTQEARQAAIDRLKSLRQRISEGGNFETLAILYSEDEGSAARGGEIGYQARSSLAPEYAAAAFKLDQDSLSDVVQTKFGFHLIQLLARRGESVNTRHILIKPELDAMARQNSRGVLDSVRNLILQDTLTFEEAARTFSEDKESRNNGGLVTSQKRNSTTIEVDDLDPALFLTIDSMEVGQISTPVPTKTQDGRTAYRIVRLEKRIEPHRANLKQDYPLLKRAAQNARKEKIIDEWMREQAQRFYLKIDSPYQSCPVISDLLKANLQSNFGRR